MGLFSQSKHPKSADQPDFQDTHVEPFDDLRGKSALEDEEPSKSFVVPPRKKTSRPPDLRKTYLVLAGGVGVLIVLSWVALHLRQKPPAEPTLAKVVKFKPASDQPQHGTASTNSTPLVAVVKPGSTASMPLTAPDSGAFGLDMARQLFLAASQNAVQVASVQPVKPGLFCVGYIVGDKSGQAWVDLDKRVVFIGTAVSPNGTVLTPGQTAAAMGATQTAAPSGSASAPVMGAMASSQGEPPSDAIQKILADHGAGFWEGNPKAPPIIAFVDPDSRQSLAFYQRVRYLIDDHKIRVYWIPVGLKDPASMPRASFILAQIGPANALKENFAGFNFNQSAGAVPANITSISMRKRIMENNNLMTGLGGMALPSVLMCRGGAIVTLAGGTAIGQIETAQECPPAIAEKFAK